MKKIITSGFIIIFAIAAIAQTEIQSGPTHSAEREGLKSWDLAAWGIAAVTVSALIFYLIYLFSGRKKYFTKRK